MENSSTPASENRNMEINTESIEHFTQIGKWTMFFSILGFSGLGLIVLIFLFAFPFSPGHSAYLSLLPLMLICAVYFFPILYLFKFSRHSRQAIDESDSEQLSFALRYLKKHYRFMGILMIIVLCLYFVVFLIALASGNLAHLFTFAGNA